MARFSFHSFRTRLLVFLLALMLPVLLGIYFFVNRENNEYTTDTINSYLELGADVFDFTREEHKNTLLTITSTMTRDWGFRNAFGTGDPYTIIDAADNILLRSLGAADMMLIAALDGEVIIDTRTQGFERLQGEWLALMNEAANNDDGIADAIINVQGIPYQITVIPLYLPTPVAWIFGGFPLDNEFTATVKQSIVSDVSIVEYQQSAQGVPALSVIASTLSEQDQLELLTQLQFEHEQTQRIRLADGEYGTLLRPLYGRSADPLQIKAVIQKSYNENIENLQAFQRVLLQFYIAVLLASLLAAVWLARSFTRPVLDLAARVRRIEDGDYGQAMEVAGRDELSQLATSVNNMAAGLAEKERVRDLLGKVVSHEIAEELLSKSIELGGEEKVVTVLFVDIKGFTALCEASSPEAVLTMLNRYLSEITRVIESCHGVVDKYTGDSVMALFGAPLSRENDAENALAAVLAIQESMVALNTINRTEGMALMEVGIGVHTGLVVAGNLGSHNRLNYTVIGDSVNLAARLEGLTRKYNTPNIVSDACRALAPSFVYKELDLVRVAGKSEPVRIYELVGEASRISDAQRNELTAFAEALAAYRAQRWSDAIEGFTALNNALPEQKRETSLYAVYLERMEYLPERELPQDWDAVFIFDRK
ncbi:MAG: adenylate/guanylate cyclase domain-containing protein [Pseudomonadales bacterium]|nr:adenylate/guanylate cyclase domain-containing protein [Pseudomonadales bacterium]MCP5331083.1 adenylate/guanylate cyclase domain-containing protein [Pseudomonadales bacterium]MCP5343546.1 adenylate/guanylate cyclase domain-containing protein [Pseudomonadales bacterium]